MSPRWIWRGVNGLAACAFLFFAVVQNNDPDPVRWMAIYLATALCCALELYGRLRWPLPAITAAVALVWAGIWAPQVMGQVDWARALSSAGMSGDPKEEMARETAGLALTAVWSLTLLAGSLVRRRYQHPFQPP
jgi:hypothetical protein